MAGRKSPKRKAARKAKSIELALLDPKWFPDRQAARVFVRGEGFASLVDAVQFALSPWNASSEPLDPKHVGEATRATAVDLLGDLGKLAAIAAHPLNAMPKLVDGSSADPAEKLEGLLEFAELVSQAADCENCARAVLTLARCVVPGSKASRHAAREVA